MKVVYTHTEKIRKLKAAAKKVLANKESRMDFLCRIGVYDKQGNLTQKYTEYGI